MAKKEIKVDFTKKKQTQEKSTQGLDLLAELLQDGEKKPKKRPYFYFEEAGIVVAFWSIISIEKCMEYFQRIHGTTHSGWLFGIVINQGIESSPNLPFGERKIFYATEQERDERLKVLLDAMEAHNYELNKV